MTPDPRSPPQPPHRPRAKHQHEAIAAIAIGQPELAVFIEVVAFHRPEGCEIARFPRHGCRLAGAAGAAQGTDAEAIARDGKGPHIAIAAAGTGQAAIFKGEGQGPFLRLDAAIVPGHQLPTAPERPRGLADRGGHRSHGNRARQGQHQ
ncbi:MAG: hypothetical protein Fur0042_26020 [Cyanophyceae cyanobacterium]